jgi:hypothetical protein
VTDLRREQYEFERDVIRVKVTGDVKVITTERVVRFFEEKIKGKVSNSLVSLVYFVTNNLYCALCIHCRLGLTWAYICRSLM